MLFYPLTPRFIISVRELYDRDVQCRCEGIDTGFGILSQPTAGLDTTVSTMVFTDDGLGGQGHAVGCDMEDLDAISRLQGLDQV